MKNYLLITLLILLQACQEKPSSRGLEIVSSSNNNQHALVIGIDKYQHADGIELKNLNGAVNDANLLTQTLRNKNINLPDNRILLNEQATLKAFLNAWQDMLKTANSGDTLILTYSGHGGRIPDEPPLGEEDKHDETLMFHDFNPDNTNEGMLIDDDIYGMLKQASTKYKIVLLLDSCHSSGATRSSRSAGTYTKMRGAGIVSISDKIEDKELPKNVTVITAVQQDNFEVEEVRINNKTHGALSWAFAQALQSNKNSLTRKQLNDFLLTTVRDKTDNMQFPKLKPEADDTIVIKLNSDQPPKPINEDHEENENLLVALKNHSQLKPLTISLQEQRQIHKQGELLHFTIDSKTNLTELTIFIVTNNKNINLRYPTAKHNNKLQILPYYLTINIEPPYGKDDLIAILCPETRTELHNLIESSTTAPKAEQIITHIDNCQVGGYSFVSSE